MSNPPNEIDILKFPLTSRLEWGASRHRLVARLAEDNLRSDNARKAIEQLLVVLNEASLPAISTWADEIKQFPPPKPSDNPETKAFLTDKRNVGNREWHYVDLPLGATSYDPDAYPYFTRADDVVQVSQICISVLLGSSDRFSKPNALRLLVHLIGDLHQPLHVGCSYISKPTGSFPFLVTDPDVAAHQKLESDRGGNSLILDFGDDATQSLHSFWDNGFSQNFSKAGGPRTVGLPSSSGGQQEGQHTKQEDLRTWVTKWATESLVSARSAYQSISIKEPHGVNRYLVAWEGKEKYLARNQQVLENRLNDAGLNLALLLDALWPQK